jgi:hypothetical protein
MHAMTDNFNIETKALNLVQDELVLDERLLPDVIQGQIGKLNELDTSVKQAIKSAKKAEIAAKNAGNLSAERGFFKDYKREAIEGLQQVSSTLAGAVQDSAKAQKISFEFQTRLAEITKYLFSLGVSNIAANRSVVRELKLRLSGATEGELSELARQEVMLVIQQLKEQEDLLKKQEQQSDKLREHDSKIKYFLDQADDLEKRFKNQDEKNQTLIRDLEEMNLLVNRQQQDLLTLQQQLVAQQEQLRTNTYELTQASTQSAQKFTDLKKTLKLRAFIFISLIFVTATAAHFLR